jgi:hypothetical protein
VACIEPSGRVIVASLPVTPDPAVAGPLTGGQNVAHEPVQFDVVAVSGPNQYTVKPLALVSTVAPPIVAVFSVLLDEAGGAAPEVLLELDELAELPQAAIISAAAARPAGASHLLFIAYLRSPGTKKVA